MGRFVVAFTPRFGRAGRDVSHVPGPWVLVITATRDNRRLAFPAYTALVGSGVKLPVAVLVVRATSSCNRKVNFLCLLSPVRHWP
ncbi:MAG: hypothetical protein JWN27_4596, partial [Candidatus Eremiobacteraeota bacterium]|nr:hypothetical protein [Candidatus Eremiobacteraeota bacterium]